MIVPKASYSRAAKIVDSAFQKAGGSASLKRRTVWLASEGVVPYGPNSELHPRAGHIGKPLDNWVKSPNNNVLHEMQNGGSPNKRRFGVH